MDQLADLPPLTGSAVLDPWRVRLRHASSRGSAQRSSAEPTLSERLLWEALRVRPEVWVPEYATGRYRLDFYCPLVQLAVEVDGASHWGQVRAGCDAERDEWHAGRGITTRRFSATQVETDAAAVLAEVVRDVTARLAGAATTLEAPTVRQPAVSVPTQGSPQLAVSIPAQAVPQRDAEQEPAPHGALPCVPVLPGRRLWRELLRLLTG